MHRFQPIVFQDLNQAITGRDDHLQYLQQRKEGWGRGPCDANLSGFGVTTVWMWQCSLSLQAVFFDLADGHPYLHSAWLKMKIEEKRWL